MPLLVFAILLSFIPLGIGIAGLMTEGVMTYSVDTFLPFPLFSFAVDGLSAFMLLVIGIVSLATSIYFIGYAKSYQGGRNVILLGGLSGLLLVSMTGVISADSVFTFLFMWETMSILSYFLVAYRYESEEVRKAGLLYLIMTHIGAVFIFASLLLLAGYVGGTGFEQVRAAAATMPPGMKHTVFVLALIGFGSKSGIVPLHIWMPRAYPAAPDPVSALMSAAMINVGLYGLIRIGFDFMGTPYAWWGVSLLVLGAISALIGILRALAESDLKRMLAFSSTENVGIIYIGLGAATLLLAYDLPEAASFAMLAALVHTINHASFKGLLFMGVGAVKRATRTANMEALGGLIKTMPWTAASFLIGAIAIAGIPPLNGFVGEWMLIQTMLHMMQSLPLSALTLLIPLVAAALVLTSGLAVICFVKAFGITFLAKPRSKAAEDAREVGGWMQAGMWLLAAGCILLGIGAPGLIRWLTPVVSPWINSVYEPKTLWFIPSIGVGGQEEVQLSLAIVAVLAAAFVMMLMLSSRLLGRRRKVQRVPTWGCGVDLEPSMAYTGISLVQPVKRSFNWFYRQQGEWEQPLKESLENNVYRPLKRWVVRWSTQVKTIQNGNIRLYLLYMFCALMVLLLLQGVGD